MKPKLLQRGIVDGTIHRWLVPFSAKQSEMELVDGDTLKIYSMVQSDTLSERMGRKILIVWFKKNNSRKITHWCFDQTEFFQNILLKNTNFLKKHLVDSENSVTL
jgi:hypothetical protein